jgi:hypothetical protein
MNSKSGENFPLALTRLLASGRIHITLGHRGATISAENALAVAAVVIIIALLI